MDTAGKYDEGVLSVSLFVIAVHLSLLVWCWWDFEQAPQAAKPQKFVVKTVALTPKAVVKQPQPVAKNLSETRQQEDTPIQQPLVEPIQQIKELELPPPPPPTPELESEPELKLSPKIKAPEVKKSVPKAKPAPKAKPTIPKAKSTPLATNKVVKKVDEKKSNPSPKAVPTKTEKPEKQPSSNPSKEKPPSKPQAKPANPKKQQLLAKAQESIAKIEASGVKIGAVELKLPQLQSVVAMADEATGELSGGERGYRDELADRLKLMLKMPEVGQVKMKLTLSRTGKLIRLAIISANSSSNRTYIEKTLPTLLFPPFGTQFGSVAEYTFSITLNSDL